MPVYLCVLFDHQSSSSQLHRSSVVGLESVIAISRDRYDPSIPLPCPLSPSPVATPRVRFRAAREELPSVARPLLDRAPSAARRAGNRGTTDRSRTLARSGSRICPPFPRFAAPLPACVILPLPQAPVPRPGLISPQPRSGAEGPGGPRTAIQGAARFA